MTQVEDVSWLISSFVDQTPGVVEAIVVSSDGLLMAMSNGLDRAGGDPVSYTHLTLPTKA